MFSHVHAVAVYLLVALTVGLLVLARRAGATAGDPRRRRPAGRRAGQGVVGFTQYFIDLPEVLVALHMLGAALTSAALTWVVVATRRTPA